MSFFGCASPGKKSADADLVSMQTTSQPMASEFVLGVGDALDITIYRNDDLKTASKINPSGRIMFPLIGEVQAAGKTLSALRDELQMRFSKYLVDPQITISVSSMQSQRVLVLGEIRNPGAISLDSDLTVMDAMAKAGGWTQDANLSNVFLLRNVSGKVESRSLDMNALIRGGELSNNYPLQRNDVVYVPTKKVADVARFMSYITAILSPVVMIESGIVLWPQALDVLEGKTSTTTPLTIPAR